ncbi:MAG: hypothetical protein ABSF44_03070 [Candidatus Bathyarchaeia archaeon]
MAALPKLGIVGFDPVDVVGMAAKMEKRKSIKAIAVMTGMMTSIKLAVRPNFLPDSSDILIPQMLFCLG